MRKLYKEDNEDVKFVLRFNKIRLSRICEKLQVSRTSINAGNSTLENYHKVRREIESELAKLYIKDYEEKQEFNTLYEKNIIKE